MQKEHIAYQDRITQDPNIMVGKPVIKGTRIPVEKVLDQLAYKPDLDELFAQFGGGRAGRRDRFLLPDLLVGEHGRVDGVRAVRDQAIANCCERDAFIEDIVEHENRPLSYGTARAHHPLDLAATRGITVPGDVDKIELEGKRQHR